jgi:O-antigen/teichoic acid export membrane protein
MIMAVSALSTAIVARQIGVGNFGVFASAQGVGMLLAGVADFGFSTVLARELASDPDGRKPVMGTSVLVATAGGLIAALAVVAIAIASGPTSPRAIVLYIIAPSLVVTGMATYRQSFMVLYQTRRLTTIDVATNVAQAVLIILVAEAGGELYGVAAVASGASIVNALLVGLAGRRLIGVSRPAAPQVRQFLRWALPLGLASFLSSMYFTIDLVLLGWLVSPAQVGEYAAAVKFLNLLVLIPGFVMAAVFPGLSSLRDDREGRSELVARIWHWLVAFGLPVCVASAVFAPVVIHLAFGHGYSASIGMFRVLSAAAAVALVSNVLGVLLSSLAIARRQVIQNTIAMIFNVAANLVLAPRFGPIASAWITLGTELFVACGSLLALRGRLDFGPSLALSRRPLVASGVLAGVGLLLGGTPAVAIPVSIVAFVVVLAALRGWPVEFAIRVPKRLFRLRVS